MKYDLESIKRILNYPIQGSVLDFIEVSENNSEKDSAWNSVWYHVKNSVNVPVFDSVWEIVSGSVSNFIKEKVND